MQALLQLYRQWCGCAPANTERLPGAASNRQYVRFYAPEGCEPRTVVGVIGQSFDENACFVYLSRHFEARGLPVPSILAVSDDGMRYLQTDLGSRSLYQALRRGRESGGGYDAAERELIRRTICRLPELQVLGAEGLDFGRCLPPVTFDQTAAMFDLNYFKYCFLRTTEVDHDELRLENDLQHLAADLVADGGNTFLYRDFQARNVMLDNADNPHFIDFQGGRRGPLQYDVASYLWQASARYPQSLREEMVSAYIGALKALMPVDEDAFSSRLRLFVLFRVMQVLGTYGFRGYFERKKYFIDSIPPAIANLRALLSEGICRPYPYLEDVLLRMVDLPRLNVETTTASVQPVAPSAQTGALVVRVFSFSYKRGIPEDESGNGGGYVFDCRGMHNPGRYEAYKNQTGLDLPVIQFLEDDAEVLTFLDSVYRLADAHVERYLERGFTALMFSFGCTGGRHRSVYCAEHLAEHLNRRFGVEVQLCHREQGIARTLPAAKKVAE